MRNTPQDSQGEKQSSSVWRAFILLGNSWCGSWCVGRLIGLVVIVVAGGIIFGLSRFVPYYIALLLTYFLGLLGWGLLIGFPSRLKEGEDVVKVWAFFALFWAAMLCGIYAEGLDQRHDSSWILWAALTWVLLISSFIVLYVSLPRKGS